MISRTTQIIEYFEQEKEKIRKVMPTTAKRIDEERRYAARAYEENRMDEYFKLSCIANFCLLHCDQNTSDLSEKTENLQLMLKRDASFAKYCALKSYYKDGDFLKMFFRFYEILGCEEKAYYEYFRDSSFSEKIKVIGQNVAGIKKVNDSIEL